MHMKTDFNINKINCTIEWISMLGQNEKDEDDLLEFLKRKGLCVSKTFFVLRPKYINFENDDLCGRLDTADLTLTINFENDDQDLPRINSYFIRTTTS